ncbi:MAG: Gfo/Idh/MocA family oxidoreductase [Clostridiales bacterium]|nr:Gfo/Idh/MocA family oxidoreductase [Clostridiales bacterium]
MKWGIIGAGSIARKFAGTVVRMQSEGEELTAIASRDQAKADAFRAEFGAARAYGSYESMIRDTDVNAVYVATPNVFHYDNVRMCLLAGKHVLCEKPFTVNAGQARELYALAREKGLFVMEAFWIRLMPLLLKMREFIAGGEIGEVRHVRCDFGFVPGEGLSERKRTLKLAAGALLDIGIYNLGFVHMIMDAAPIRFSSTVRFNDFGSDDFSAVLLEYPGGRSASIVTAIGMNMPREAVVYGSEGSLHFPDYQQAQRMTVRRYGQEAYEIEIPFEINGFEYQIREVSRCVALGMTTSDVLREQDTLTVLETMDALRESWGLRYEADEPAR